MRVGIGCGCIKCLPVRLFSLALAQNNEWLLAAGARLALRGPWNHACQAVVGPNYTCDIKLFFQSSSTAAKVILRRKGGAWRAFESLVALGVANCLTGRMRLE